VTTYVANGGVFNGAGGLSQYSNSIVSSPTLFKFAQGGAFQNTGLMGEAGPEAIMPLTRIGGKLGVRADGLGGGGCSVVVNLIESPGNGGKTQERQDGNTRILDIWVEQIKSAVAGDIARGNGPVGGAIERTYGLNRTAGAY
jgi:phage-related minor tail protein